MATETPPHGCHSFVTFLGSIEPSFLCSSYCLRMLSVTALIDITAPSPPAFTRVSFFLFLVAWAGPLLAQSPPSSAVIDSLAGSGWSEKFNFPLSYWRPSSSRLSLAAARSLPLSAPPAPGPPTLAAIGRVPVPGLRSFVRGL